MALQKNPGPLLTSKRYGAVQNFPVEFLADIGLITLVQENPVDVEPLQIGSVPLLVESNAEQTRTDERKRTDVYLTEIPSGVLESEVKLDSGLVGTRTRKLVPEGTPLEPVDGLTEIGNQNNLGNGWLDQTLVEAPSLWPHFVKTKSRPIVTPEDFRALLQEDTIVQTLFQPMPDPVLAIGEIERTHEEIDVFKFRESVHSIDPLALPATNINSRTNRAKQVETVTRILRNAFAPPVSPTATRDVEFTRLGDGTALEIHVDVDEVFDELKSSINTLNLIPDAFRGLIPDFERSEVVEGVVVDPPVTGTEIAKSEDQLTVFTKRVTSRTLGNPSLPISYANQELGAEQFGGEILTVELTLDDAPLTISEGEDVVEATTRTLSPSLFLKTVKKRYPATEWPLLSSRLWDEDMRLEYDETKQVIDAIGATEDPDPGGVFSWLSEVKAIDKWRSLRINTSKSSPIYVDEASALISYEYKPYRFPGYLYAATAINPYYVRHADAQLVQHLVKTWWLKTVTTPTVGVPGSGSDVEVEEIVMDDVVIGSLNNINSLTYSGPCLHDDITIGATFYPATTPSYTRYVLGIPTGGTTLINIISLFTPGSTGGYLVGDIITVAGGGFSATTDVTCVYDIDSITGLICGMTFPATSGTFPAGGYGPFSDGGSGSGALFNVTAHDQPNYTPGTQWIGTYRVVGASVTPAKAKDVWKIQTESVVMR